MDLQVREATERLSLGVIVPDLTAGGGAERFALQCVQRWQERHQIALYSKGFDRELLGRFQISDDVACRELPGRVWPKAPSHPADRILEAALLATVWGRALDSHDVYLAHQWPMHRIGRRPLVWYAHELHRHSYDLRRRRGERDVANNLSDMVDRPGLRDDDRHELIHDFIRSLDRNVEVDRVVANSRFTADQLERALGRNDVDVVYPGVDLEPEPPAAADADPSALPYFLSVGSLAPHKQHRPAIEALTLATGARLVLVGRGDFAKDLRRMISRLGIEDRVEIRDEVDDAELRELYAGCRAVVFTPTDEPFGMVALEALAAGKPLLGCDTGGFAEVVDAACAMIVPAEPAALAEAMNALLANAEGAERMGAAGRKLAENYSWERTAQELEAILIDAHRTALERAPASPSSGTLAGSTRVEAPRDARAIDVGVRLCADFGDGFHEGNWRRLSSPTPMPRHGFYASHHEGTLRRQLAEIEDCGFDFVTLSIGVSDWKVAPQGIATLRNALELAPELGRAGRFAVELVLQGTPTPLVESALDWLGDLARLDGWYRVEGRPLVLLKRDAPPRADASHPDLHVLEVHGPKPAGPIAWVGVGDDDPAEAALGALLDDATGSGAAHTAVIVSSWNDHLAGDTLEETIDGSTTQRDSIRAVLRNR